MYNHSDYCCQNGTMVAYSHFTDSSWAYIYNKNDGQFIYSIQKIMFSYGSSTIEFIPNWDWLTELDLSGCSAISYLPPLSNVRDVTIFNCMSITTLPQWPKVHKFILQGCPNIPTFPNWSTIRIVRISNNDIVTSLPCWPTAREVVICNFTKLQNFPNWPQIDNFTCITCPLISTLPKWRNILAIGLHNCQNLTISIYPNIRHVNFSFLNWTVPCLLPTERRYMHMCVIKKVLLSKIAIEKWRLFCSEY